MFPPVPCLFPVLPERLCMRTLSVILAVALAATSSLAAAGGPGHHHTPQHGGIVVSTKQADLEIVARPDRIQIFLDDHGKPVPLQGATAKVTLLNGADKSDVRLLPAGNALEAQGRFAVAPGTRGVVVVTLAGKAPITTRFTVK